MKKIFLLLTVFSMVFTSCEPLEMINAESDAMPNPIVGDAEYTLTADDYEALELNYGSFGSVDAAKSAIPPFLAEMFPVWGKNSSVLLGYKLYIGSAFSLKDYSLKQEDYTFSGSDLLGFKSDVEPGDYLADIISSNYSSPKEGDYVAATYFQYTGNAYVVTPTISLEENFNLGTTAGDLTTITSNWVTHSGGNPFVGYSTASLSMEDYPASNIGGSVTIALSGKEDVNTSITPIIETKTVYSSALVNFSEVGDGTYFFHLMEQDGSYNFSARVGAKSDGSGNMLFGIGASSSSLTYGTTAFNLDTTYLLVASYNIESGVSNLHILTSPLSSEPSNPEATNTGIAGNSANRIGIRQGTDGPTGTIDGIRVANTWSAIMSNDELDDETVGTKVSNKAVYTFTNSAWEVPSTGGFYLLSDVDFVSMGLENFGSSTPPEDYLPAFLNIKFPYALEGSELNVTYTYVSSSSGAQTRGNSYTKIDGIWVGYKSTIDTTLQFGHDGSTWVPDNTIKYTLVRNTDYEYMASQLTDAEYAGLIGNLASYGDFDYNWTDAQIHFALALFLDYLDPSAAEGQKYILTYVIYDNGENDYQTSFIKTDGAWVLND
jgi:hypothetical protein